jgi:diguanylate cyclase (GGDEF)-like protein
METPFTGGKVCATCGLILSGTKGPTHCPDDQSTLTVIEANPFGDSEVGKQYQIISLLGRGGWGLVFKGKQVSLDRYVAVKMLHTHLLSDPETASRFKREAALVSKLNHQNITTVYDFGILPNQQPYLVMEYLPGTNLEEVLKKQGKLSFEETLPILLQICDGLQAAHERKIVHRDMKPSNVRLVETNSGRTSVKIMDFGLARLSDQYNGSPNRLTRTGQTIGTPAYMSPEQCTGDPLDQRSDIYAVGCLMYEMLSGAPAAVGTSMYEIMHSHVHAKKASLSSHGVQVPPGIEEIVQKAMARDPAGRYSNASELKKALEKYKSQGGRNQTSSSTQLPATSATDELLPTKEKSFFAKLVDGICGFFGSLNVRVALLFVFGALLSFFIADQAYPFVVKESYNQLTIHLAEQAKGKAPTTEQILNDLHTYNCAWYYITATNGKPLPRTASFMPKLKGTPQNVGRTIEWNGKNYWESVAIISDDQILHVGFDLGPVFYPRIIDLDSLATASCSLLNVLLALGFLMIFVMISLDYCVSKHLARLSRACMTLLLSRDAYSGVTGGGLNTSGAVTEVSRMAQGLRDVRLQYDQQVTARLAKDEELKRQKSSHETEKESITKEYVQQLTQTQAKISELYTKDAEEEFMLLLSREIDMLKSSTQLCQRLLDKLNDKFPTSITHGVFLRQDRSSRMQVVASLGFNERSLTALKRIDWTMMSDSAFGSGMHSLLSTESFQPFGMQTLGVEFNFQAAAVLPLSFQSRDLGILIIYAKNEKEIQERMRVLRNVVEMGSRQLYQTVLYEEEVEAARTDPLTGLRNKKFFQEIVPTMFERAAVNPAQNPISFAIIDGDHFKRINDTYGHQVGDRVLEELAQVLRNCVRTVQFETHGARGDYLIRFGGEEFIVVMEKTPTQQAYEVAERIRKAVATKTDWPGAVGDWSISIGVATYPADAQSGDELLQKADTALYYVKEELGRNRVCAFSQVPKTYKYAKKAGSVSGELGVFEPAALLQSLATAQKTGVLTVQSPNDKHFWLLVEAGKPVQARLGKFGGNNAIVEFISTFEDGSFSFQEKLTNKSSGKLATLAEEFNVSKGLERCLMDAALAQDNYQVAKTVISSSEIWIRPVPEAELEARWKAIMQLPDPPSPDEAKTMTEMLQLAGTGKPLSTIFTAMEPRLTSTVWRCASLLVQHGLVQTRQPTSPQT